MLEKFPWSTSLLCLVMGLAVGAVGQRVNSGAGLGSAVPAFLLVAIAFVLLAACLAMLLRETVRRREIGHRLDEVERLYRLLAAATDEIVLQLDGEGSVTYASPALGRSGIWRDGELEGRTLLDYVHLAHKAHLQTRMAMIGTAHDRSGWDEFIALGPDGSEHWFEMRISPCPDDRGLVAVLRPIAERKSLEAQLHEAGLTDPLTGLANRSAFIRVLQRHLETPTGGCIALFDLDHFRALNDRYGHAVGDKVLVLFAQILRGQVRTDDTVARLSGEKFGVLLPRATPEQAEAVCQRILATLSDAPRPVGTAIVRVSASAGVGRLGGSADDALKAADHALLVAKAKGRGRLEMAPRLRPLRQSRW